MRLSKIIAALSFLILSPPLEAGVVAGHDYTVLSLRQHQEVSGKTEIIEFFSWGCPHCYEFYPKLARWLATLPKEVRVNRVPVSLGHPEWEALAKAYYALQSTGDAARLDAPLFEDIHRNHVWLHDEPSITAWVAKHGVDAAKFSAAYRSFGVNTSTEQAEQNAVDYRLPGVPALAIAGKYLVTGEQDKMLATSTELLAMERGTNRNR